MQGTSMKNKIKRIIEIFCLAVLVMLNLLGVCWGPPGPPSTPVGNTEMSVFTIGAMAVYGFWKMRK